MQNAYNIKQKRIRFLPPLNKPTIIAGQPVAQDKFIILKILAIFFKLYRGDVTSTLSILVFKDLDLVNYNIDKLSKAIKDKYTPTAIISINGKKYIAVLR